MLKDILDRRAEIRSQLYVRGFLITTKELTELESYPFYGNWKYVQFGKYFIYHHQKLKLHTYSQGDDTYYLLGHAYNPFTREVDESMILKHFASIPFDTKEFWKYEASLTGMYVAGMISGDTITHWVDCTGMLISYYGIIDDEYYCTSHSLLVAELCGLKEDPYVTELKNYKFYNYFGRNLPADLSPFEELKRCVPNHEYIYKLGAKTIDFKRFFPYHRLKECRNERDYDILVERVSRIMRDSMDIIAEKWPDKRAAISVTGGRDSGMTLASAKNSYDKFKYFSYISEPQEAVDAHAARKICKGLGLEHHIYEISDIDEDFQDIEIYRQVLEANQGNIGINNANDVRKRVFFLENRDFDIEIKSWVDEIGRARYYKRFSKRHFPKKQNPRFCSSVYKVFVHNRRLLYKTDRRFEKYLDKYVGKATTDVMSWLLALYWEFGWSAGEGLSMTSEHLFSYDITIPYNNRRIVELLLRAPLKYRIEDKLQHDVIVANNKMIEDLNIHIVDVDHTKNRALIERAYLEINTHLPL